MQKVNNIQHIINYYKQYPSLQSLKLNEWHRVFHGAIYLILNSAGNCLSTVQYVEYYSLFALRQLEIRTVTLQLRTLTALFFRNEIQFKLRATHFQFLYA